MYNLKVLKPIQIDDLVRCGKKYDGGYVLSQSQILRTKVLLSFGINADYSFEYDFSKKNPNVEIYAYDHSTPEALSVGLLPKIPRKWIKQLVNPRIFIYKTYLRIREYLWRKKHPFNDFFDKSKRKYFFDKFVGTKDNGQFASIDTVFKNINCSVAENDVFAKIDIEAAEYDIIPLFKPYLHLINGFVFEFHQLGEVSGEKFNKILPLLFEQFYIAHVHANNLSGFIEGTKLPLCLEITFIKKNLVENPDKPYTYPRGLDFPDFPYLPEMKLEWLE